MRRLDLASNSAAAAMSVELSKDKSSPNLEGSSTMHPRRDKVDDHSPMSQLQTMGRNRRSYSMVTSLERL